MEEGASTSSFSSRTSPFKQHHTIHPIRTAVITSPITIIAIISLEGGPEEGEGVMGSLWLMVALQELEPPHGPGYLILGPYN